MLPRYSVIAPNGMCALCVKNLLKEGEKWMKRSLVTRPSARGAAALTRLCPATRSRPHCRGGNGGQRRERAACGPCLGSTRAAHRPAPPKPSRQRRRCAVRCHVPGCPRGIPTAAAPPSSSAAAPGLRSVSRGRDQRDAPLKGGFHFGRLGVHSERIASSPASPAAAGLAQRAPCGL